MRFFSRSLLARIVVSFFVLSAIIVALLAAVAYAVIVGDARRAVLAQLDTLVTAKEMSLASWLRESRKQVELAATLEVFWRAEAPGGGEAYSGPADPEASSAIRGLLHSLLARSPELGELVYAVARGGLVVASTTPELEGQYRVHDTWFTRGLEGPYAQNVYPSPVTLQPTLTVAAPVIAPDGRHRGVLAANLDLKVLDQTVRELSGPFPTAESYLVDRLNSLVSAERYGSESYPRGVHSTGIDAAIAGLDGSGRYTSYRGIPVIGVYRWLAHYELALLVEVPTSDAFRAARRHTATIAGVGLGVVAVLALGVLLLARRIAAPILAVEAAARRVARGDLRARATVETHDEIGTLAASFNEMTERLEELYATLQRNEERFRSLIDASSDVIMLLDRAGRVVFVSPTVERLYGYRPADVLGTDIFTVIHPDDAERVRGDVYGRLVREPRGASLSAECRVRHRDGRWLVVEAAARNLLDQPGVEAILVDSRDITERRHLEAELVQAQRLEAVGRLAGGIAHDFNNLLTAIAGYAELLAMAGSVDAEAGGYVAEIRNAAARAAALTQQLLAYSRKQVLRPRVLDLNGLVNETESLLRRVIGENIVIRTTLDPHLWPVEADPAQIQRVIFNLAVNSRDAMPEGGVLTLRTQNRPSGGAGVDLSPGLYVELEVTDTGVGMGEATLSRLFEPFFTTKEVGRGTGLGLATAYGIVRQSGGAIAVESMPGAGATFRVLLPASASAAEEEGKEEPTRQAAGNESILLVEDEEAVRVLMHHALSRSGYRVVSAGDPRQALGLAESGGGADLLVTDVVMPGMDGRRLAEELQSRYPGMKVLYVSGYTENQSLRLGVSTDRLPFLQKPFTPAQLTRRVREILDAVAG